jgi:hypothetical protein
MPIPKNAQAIYTFLTGAGFNANAAAGIVGNIEQESGGDPAAPGGGLIQILSGNPGYTSNTSLSAQLQSIITYVKANGSIADINAHASSPSAAALYFSTKYERPLASAANNPNRQSSADAVATAAKSGNWSTAASSVPSATGASGGGAGSDILGWLTGSTGFLSDFKDMFTIFHNLISPSFWLRIGAFFIGSALLIFGIYALVKANGDGSLMPQSAPVPIPV